MTETITLSINPQDAHDLNEHPDWSASKIFRSAMKLQRSREEFMDIYDICDFKLKISDLQEKIMTLQKEIVRRNERIDSLQDVLAQKELAIGRLRKADQTDNGIIGTIAEVERLA